MKVDELPGTAVGEPGVFTLRMVAAAEREGLVDLDLAGGRVALRPASEAVCRQMDVEHHLSPALRQPPALLRPIPGDDEIGAYRATGN